MTDLLIDVSPQQDELQSPAQIEIVTEASGPDTHQMVNIDTLISSQGSDTPLPSPNYIPPSPATIDRLVGDIASPGKSSGKSSSPSPYTSPSSSIKKAVMRGSQGTDTRDNGRSRAPTHGTPKTSSSPRADVRKRSDITEAKQASRIVQDTKRGFKKSNVHPPPQQQQQQKHQHMRPPLPSKTKMASPRAPQVTPKTKLENSVQSFLKQHPEFAEEFSRTIPVSPSSVAVSSPEMQASAARSARKGADIPARYKTAANQPIAPAETAAEYEDDEPLPVMPKRSKAVAPASIFEDNGVEVAALESAGDEFEDSSSSNSGDDVGPTVASDVESPQVFADDNEQPQKQDHHRHHHGQKHHHHSAAAVVDNGGGDFEADDVIDDDDDPSGEEKEETPAETTTWSDDDPLSQPQDAGSTTMTSSSDKDKDKKKKEEEVPMTEEEEALEKMSLLEEIKEGASMGFMPPNPPSLNMPLKTLRQIKAFQDEMASRAIHVGLMGTGLVSLVGILETLNGRFDPIGKILGRGLKLQGAKDKVEANLALYKIPFIKLYKKLRTKGLGGDLPPWVQITLITAGILKEVHVENEVNEMQEKAQEQLRDPMAAQRAREIWMAQERQRQMQQQMARDRMPYHETMQLQQQQMPASDAELEKQLAEEFAGFDKLPDLNSIARRGQVPTTDTAATATTTPVPATAESKAPTQKTAPPMPAAAAAPKDVVDLVHETDPNAKRGEAIDLKHPAGTTTAAAATAAAAATTTAEETDSSDSDDDDDDDTDYEEDSPRAPIISVGGPTTTSGLMAVRKKN